MKKVACLAVFLFSATPVFCWPACSGSWVQVPAGTPGAYKSGDVSFTCQTKTVTNNLNLSNSTSKSSSSSTATGGTASVGPITNTANGGAAAASNNSSGNSIESSVTIPHMTATAYAPDGYPTAQCFKPFGIGAQSGWAGGTFGGGKIDENCAILEAARKARNRLTFCKIYITQKYVRKAGVTMEDCMYEEEVVSVPAPVVPQAPPQIIVSPPNITVNIPHQPVVPTTPVIPPVPKVNAKKHVACPPQPCKAN